MNTGKLASNSVVIRRACERDVGPSVAISNWAALNTPANFAIEPESIEVWLRAWRETQELFPWLVAVNAHEDVVGFAKATPHKGRCAYAYTAEVSVYVHPLHHRQRIGHALYAEILPILKAQGFATLLAGITIPNPASQRLHESFGFRQVATYERVGWKFGRWHDVGYWQLNLSLAEQPPPRLLQVAEVDAKGPPLTVADFDRPLG